MIFQVMTIYIKLAWDCLLVKLFLITRVNIPVADGSRIYSGVNKNIKIKI